MRNIIFLLLSLFLFKCHQEDFSPISDFNQKLVVYCVLDSRSDTQILLLQKNSDSWNVEDRLNISNKISAQLLTGNSKYLFKDTILNEVTNFKSYYIKCPVLLSSYYSLQIIDSSSRPYKSIYSVISYPNKMSSSVTYENKYYSFGYLANNNKFHAYIFYKQKINNDWIFKKEELPFLLETIEGKDYVFYPGDEFQTDNLKIFKIPYKSIEECLFKIRSHVNSEDLIIIGGFIIFENYDSNLAQYIKTTNGFFDKYSVRLDQFAYTNINNGLGVFGGIRIDTVNFF